MQFTPILGAAIPQAFDSMRYGNGIKSGLPSAVRGALYFAAAAAATGRAGAFCANAGDAMIACMITARIAMMAMNLSEARIQILHSNRAPAHHGFGLAGSLAGSLVPLFQQVRARYKIDSTFIPGGRDASAFFSTIGPAICTSWPTWKFSIS
jgi:hypothetical protein